MCHKNVTIDPDHHLYQSGFLYNCTYPTGYHKVQVKDFAFPLNFCGKLVLETSGWGWYLCDSQLLQN